MNYPEMVEDQVVSGTHGIASEKRIAAALSMTSMSQTTAERYLQGNQPYRWMCRNHRWLCTLRFIFASLHRTCFVGRVLSSSTRSYRPAHPNRHFLIDCSTYNTRCLISDDVTGWNRPCQITAISERCPSWMSSTSDAIQKFLCSD